MVDSVVSYIRNESYWNSTRPSDLSPLYLLVSFVILLRLGK